MATPGRAEGPGGLRRGAPRAAGLDPLAGTPPGTMSYLTVPSASGAAMERPPRAETQPPGHAGLPLPHAYGTHQQQRKPRAGWVAVPARPCQRLAVLLRGTGHRLAQLLRGLRQHSRHITRSVLFRLGVVVVVCVHTLMLVAQTFAALQIRGEWFFSVLDAVFLCVYVVEALVKIVAFGLDYFHDPWNDIDFLVMGLMLLDFTLPLVVLPGNAWFEDVVALLRLLRIFKGVRAFRLVHLLLSLRALESLQELAGTFALSGRSIGAILLLMFTCLFIFSVLLRDLFARSDPGRFGHLLDTVFALFQLLTLDDWAFIYRDSAQQGASYIIIFLMAYILIEYFTCLNLVIAVLVDNFQMSLIRRQELKKRKQWLELQESISDSGPTVLDTGLGLAEDDERLAQLVERLEGSDRQKRLLLGHLRRLAQVERLQQEFRSRAATSDHIIDTFFETAKQDFLHH